MARTDVTLVSDGLRDEGRDALLAAAYEQLRRMPRPHQPASTRPADAPDGRDVASVPLLDVAQRYLASRSGEHREAAVRPDGPFEIAGATAPVSALCLIALIVLALF